MLAAQEVVIFNGNVALAWCVMNADFVFVPTPTVWRGLKILSHVARSER